MTPQINHKPFNLEAAKAGKPVITRSGQPARIICFDRKTTTPYKILALIEEEGGETETYLTFTLDGKFQDNPSAVNSSDLFMAPEEVTRYIHIFQNRQTGDLVASPILTIEELKIGDYDTCGLDYITTQKLTFNV